jgi:hypothetical protein
MRASRIVRRGDLRESEVTTESSLTGDFDEALATPLGRMPGLLASTIARLKDGLDRRAREPCTRVIFRPCATSMSGWMVEMRGNAVSAFDAFIEDYELK